MRWLVEAADTKTGEETAITVEALTEADAERLAHYNGLLVSRVRKYGARPAPVVPYAAPADAGAPPAAEFPQLARAARAARRVGLAMVVIGWVALVVGVAAFVDGVVRRGPDDWADWRQWLTAAAEAAWRPGALGAAALAAGTTMRLLAAMALALRAATRAARRAESRGGGVAEGEAQRAEGAERGGAAAG